MFVIDRAMDDRAPDCLYSTDQSLSLYLEAVVDARVVVTPNIIIILFFFVIIVTS